MTKQTKIVVIGSLRVNSSFPYTRVSQQYLEETIGKMRAMLDMDQLQEDDFKFIHYLLGRQELSQKDISVICLSLFGDGLATVSGTQICPALANS